MPRTPFITFHPEEADNLIHDIVEQEDLSYQKLSFSRRNLRSLYKTFFGQTLTSNVQSFMIST
jgi:hypothetical protein